VLLLSLTSAPEQHAYGGDGASTVGCAPWQRPNAEKRKHAAVTPAAQNVQNVQNVRCEALGSLRQAFSAFAGDGAEDLVV
jgi:hypothetical protein